MAKFGRSKDAEKICTVCGLPKSDCLAQYGGTSKWGDDKRGVSSGAGIRQFSDSTLTAMTRGRASEGYVADLARQELKRWAVVQPESPEDALSPYERQIYATKGIPVSQGVDRYWRRTPDQTLRKRSRAGYAARHSSSKVEREAARAALSPPDPD